ncbi:MAG: PilZ domain-containing protein [bacterium]
MLLTKSAPLSKILKKELGLAGYYLESVKTLDQTLEKVKKADLLIIDDLAFSRGAFIDQLKSANPHLPLILMYSPDNDSPRHDKLFSQGSIEHCIFKPFMPQSMSSLIRNAINKKRMLLEKEKKVSFIKSFSNERRKAARKKAAVDVSYSFVDKSKGSAGLVTGKTRCADISTQGMKLERERVMNLPAYMELKVFLPQNNPVWVTGRVMWEKEKSAGIGFIDFKPQDINLISDYLTSI